MVELTDDFLRRFGRVEKTVEEQDDRLGAHDVAFAEFGSKVDGCANGIEAITARLDKREEIEREQRKLEKQNRREDRRLIVTTALAAATLVIGAVSLFANGGIG